MLAEFGVQSLGIAQLDLACVTNRAQKENSWTNAEATAAEADYRKFLMLLQLRPTAKVVPSQAIDEMWHNHILHLRKYLEDCRQLFGRIIYHDPFEGKPDVELIRGTKLLFLEEFGSIPETYEPVQESGCCSGGTCCQWWTSCPALRCEGRVILYYLFMSLYPKIRIQISPLIERRFGIEAMDKEKVKILQKEWIKYDKPVLKTLQDTTGLTFAQNIIDVYIVDPNATGGCSDPLIIGGGVKKRRFVYLLAHELTHRLMYDNENNINWHVIARKIWKEESRITAHHIVVNAVLELAFSQLGKDDDIDLDKKISKKSEEYDRAWKIVVSESASNIIQNIKSYTTLR